MLRWADFEVAASELATLGRERFERFGFLFVGTVRRDGGPRVNPVEAYVVDGHLVLNMMWHSAFITYDPDGTQHVRRWRRDQPTVYERVAKG